MDPLQEDEVGHLIYTKYKSHLKIDSRTNCKSEGDKDDYQVSGRSKLEYSAMNKIY